MPTLSKIENGRQNPSRKLFEALTERLGVSLGLYNIPITQAEYRRYQIEYECIRLGAKGGTQFNEKLKKLLQEYKDADKEMDSLEEQFYKSRLAIQYEREQKFEDAKDLLEESIKITIPRFTLQKKYNYRFLTREETIILINLARIQYFRNEKDSAIDILYSLKEFFENESDSHDMFAKFMPCILFNLANYEEDKNNFTAEKDLAQQGIDICIKYDKLAYLDLLLFQRGFALAKLENFKSASRELKLSFDLMILKNAEERYERGFDAVKKEFGSKLEL